MGWMYVLVGGVFEVGWAIGLKYTEGFTEPKASGLTLLCLIISFYLFAKAMKMLPIGTAYAVYTGIGSAGTAIVGMMVFDEPVTVARIFFLTLLVGGIMGLKMIAEETPVEETAKVAQEG